MTDRAIILKTAKYNLRRALAFERRRLTDAEWGELCAWVRARVAEPERAEQRQAGGEGA